ncbi:MAG: T9SS type A sorting domain-containing protein, partial [Flavobacteriales bacterium]
EFNLYPNPANDFVKLDFKTTQSSNSTIRIIDLKGSEVMNLTKSINPGSNLITISTADLNEGIYIIQINDGVNQLNKKMQVVK